MILIFITKGGMKAPLILLLLLFSGTAAFPQEADSAHYRIGGSVFSNGPSFPFSGKPFQSPYHMGATADLSGPFSHKENGRWEWSLGVGYFHQRLSHTSFQFRPGLRFHHKTGLDGFEWEFAAHPGYLYTLLENPRYVLNKEGEYIPHPRAGRSQFTFDLSTGPAYSPPSTPEWEFFLNYRIWAQMPFVKQYVPVLPNTAFHIGIRRAFFKKDEE